MIDEFNQAVKQYQTKWDAMVQARTDKKFFEALKPTAIGWKVSDRAEYNRRYAELHDQCDRIFETWMNERWVAKLHLREAKLEGGVEIVKLMQRRPGSDDATGLDHLDFYSPKLPEVEKVLQKETGLKWSNETNDVVDNYGWISIWFDGTEAKLKPDAGLDIVVRELQETSRAILSGKS